jgi:hypothetical protein
MVYACNPNYLGRWDREDHGLRPVQALISKITRAKWIGGMAQAVEHLLWECESVSSAPPRKESCNGTGTQRAQIVVKNYFKNPARFTNLRHLGMRWIQLLHYWPKQEIASWKKQEILSVKRNYPKTWEFWEKKPKSQNFPHVQYRTIVVGNLLRFPKLSMIPVFQYSHPCVVSSLCKVHSPCFWPGSSDLPNRKQLKQRDAISKVWIWKIMTSIVLGHSLSNIVFC